MPRSRSSFRKALTQSKMRSNACAASRGNSLSSCRSGPRRQSWKPIRRCRRVVSHLRDLRSGDRRRAPVRYAKTADVLPRPCPGGELDRRYDPTEGLTLAGNRRARRALVEAAWTYRYPARVSDTLRARLYRAADGLACSRGRRSARGIRGERRYPQDPRRTGRQGFIAVAPDAAPALTGPVGHNRHATRFIRTSLPSFRSRSAGCDAR
jgi:hypothetical protein